METKPLAPAVERYFSKRVENKNHSERFKQRISRMYTAIKAADADAIIAVDVLYLKYCNQLVDRTIYRHLKDQTGFNNTNYENAILEIKSPVLKALVEKFDYRKHVDERTFIKRGVRWQTNTYIKEIFPERIQSYQIEIDEYLAVLLLANEAQFQANELAEEKIADIIATIKQYLQGLFQLYKKRKNSASDILNSQRVHTMLKAAFPVEIDIPKYKPTKASTEAFGDLYAADQPSEEQVQMGIDLIDLHKIFYLDQLQQKLKPSQDSIDDNQRRKNISNNFITLINYLAGAQKLAPSMLLQENRSNFYNILTEVHLPYDQVDRDPDTIYRIPVDLPFLLPGYARHYALGHHEEREHMLHTIALLRKSEMALKDFVTGKNKEEMQAFLTKIPLVSFVLCNAEGKMISSGYNGQDGVFSAVASFPVFDGTTEGECLDGTLYITMEPHHILERHPGKEDLHPFAIRCHRSGIKKVVIAHLHPDPSLSEKGKQMCKEGNAAAASISTTTAVDVHHFHADLIMEAMNINQSFIQTGEKHAFPPLNRSLPEILI